MKLRREVSTHKQRLRSIKILENQAKKSCTLNNSLFNIAPLVGSNQERNNIDFPWPVCAERIAVDVVGDAILPDTALGSSAAAPQLTSGPMARSDSIKCAQ